MKVSSEASAARQEEIFAMQRRWDNEKKQDVPRQYLVVLACESKPASSGTKSIVGIPLSLAWWNVFKYWITTRLGHEGLLVTSVSIEEVTSTQPLESSPESEGPQDPTSPTVLASFL